MFIQLIRLVRAGHHVEAAVVSVHWVYGRPRGQDLVCGPEREVQQVLEAKLSMVNELFVEWV